MAIDICYKTSEENELEILNRITNIYDNIANKKLYIHATPSLMNAGTNIHTMISCYLSTFQDDLDKIFELSSEFARFSKGGGGIGCSLTNIRCEGSRINSTNGHSRGIIALVKKLASDVGYVDQGGGKRNGSISPYIEPWHADIENFLRLKMPNTESYIRDVFPALWMNDLFFTRLTKRIETKQPVMWSLMDPKICSDLTDSFGDDFEKRYLAHEEKREYIKQVDIAEIFEAIFRSVQVSGMPYMCSKDNANKVTNHQNYGVIHSSNLCAEIYQSRLEGETSCCNLASICLPNFIKFYDENKNENVKNFRYSNVGYFDFEKLGEIVGEIVENIDSIISSNNYKSEGSKINNLKLRPMAIGVQGLADLYMLLEIPFESENAKKLNFDIFQTIYYYALKKSSELAKKFGSYPMFEGSPLSKGILQFDYYGEEIKNKIEENKMYNFDELREIVKNGVRNSLMIGLMPTASTSQIQDCSESIEPISNMIFIRQTLAGTFRIISKPFIVYLLKHKIYNKNIIAMIKNNSGKLKGIRIVDDDNLDKIIHEIFKTSTEIRQKEVIQQAIDRQPFVDQGQSLNLNFNDFTATKYFASLMMGLKGGLKTLHYYVRQEETNLSKGVEIDIRENNTNKNKNRDEKNRDEKNRDEKDKNEKDKNEKEDEVFVCTKSEGCISCQ